MRPIRNYWHNILPVNTKFINTLIMKPTQILLIDDDRDDQFIFNVAMHEAVPEAKCNFCFDCFEAIDGLINHSIPFPDYIFLDWGMLRTNGPECVQKIKGIIGNDHISFFILSGAMPELNHFQMKNVGIDKILIKQDSISQLANELAQCFPNTHYRA